MKLSDIFRKKGTVVKATESIVKIDKKQLSKLTGGVELESGTIVTDNKHPQGTYLVTDNKHPEGSYK